MSLENYLPNQVNQGKWINAYTLNALQDKQLTEVVLPICSMGTPLQQCAKVGELILPPLFHEALDESLKAAILSRISDCVKLFSHHQRIDLKVVELPRKTPKASHQEKVVAFSVDTAVEEHGPHLPLGTDTIQSYAVLSELAKEFDSLEICHPLEYGQLTWGLPFGFSIDLTADLLSRYVAKFVQAIGQWKQPSAIYVVDVHGSIVHRQAIVSGLQASDCEKWTFRWLHEPLAHYASRRGDQHAGGVETALIEHINPSLLDHHWWPARINELAEGQLDFHQAVELSSDLPRFTEYVREHGRNGIVGSIHNYHTLNASQLFAEMMNVAKRDLGLLLSGTSTKNAGEDLW